MDVVHASKTEPYCVSYEQSLVLVPCTSTVLLPWLLVKTASDARSVVWHRCAGCLCTQQLFMLP